MSPVLSGGRQVARRCLAAVGAASLIVTGFVSTAFSPASADTPSSGIVINEVFSANDGASAENATKYDWVELRNLGDASVDVNNWRLYDDKTDTVKNYTIGVSNVPVASTVIPAGGYLVLYIAKDPGLGKGDSVSLTGPSDSGVFDQAHQVGNTVTWPAGTHADPSWARTADGKYAVSKAATPGAANSFDDSAETVPTPAPTPVEPMQIEKWPGLQTVKTIDNSGEFGAKGSGGGHTDGNLSGLVYQAAQGGQPATLWAANNDLNPTIGETKDKGAGGIHKFVQKNGKWQQDANEGWTWAAKDGQTKGGKQLHYQDGTGGVDSEGLTLANGSAADGVFIASERDNTKKNTLRPSILRYDVSKPSSDTNGDGAEDLSATNEWNLKPLIEGTGVTLGKDDANLGLEGVALVPDNYLTEHHFKAADGSVYKPADTPHFGGLFFAALEKNGHIYAVSVDANSNDVSLVKDIALPDNAKAAGFSVIQDLYFDADSQNIWAQCDNSCGATDPSSDTPDGSAKLASYVLGADGNFTINHIYGSPDAVAKQNTEGFAIAPVSSAWAVAGGQADPLYRSVFFADDGVDDGFSLREGYMAAGKAEPAPIPTPATAKLVVSALPAKTTYGRSVRVMVKLSTTGQAKPAGIIRVAMDGKTVKSAVATAKPLTVKLPQRTRVGKHKVTVQFVASASSNAKTSTASELRFRVVKASTKTRVKLSKHAKRAGSHTQARIGVDVFGTKLATKGKARVYLNGKYLHTVKVSRGKAKLSVKVPRTRAKRVALRVNFIANGNLNKSTAKAKLRVR